MFFTSHRDTAAPHGSSLFHHHLSLGVAALGALALAGCSGGGSSGGTIEGLTIADQMSVVTTNSPASTSTVAPHAQADTSSFAATSDYNTDVAHQHVYDPSMDTLQMVNQILCMLTQTAYSQVVNEGLYKAQIDEKKCDSGSDTSSSDTGQSSGAGAAAPEIWVVNCSRSSADGDETVDFWVPQSGDNGSGDGTIRAHMVIHEGVSETNPFGKFDLNFIGVPTGGTLADSTESGFLRTVEVAPGHIGFQIFHKKGDINVPQAQNEHAELVQGAVDMLADQSTGVGHVLRQERSHFGGLGGDTQTNTEYALAFDLTNVQRDKDQAFTPTCLSRTTFLTNIWRYNLYDATNGARIELNSGFGFKTAAGDYGYIGYYGMWVQPGVTVDNGDVITKDVFGSQTATQYTVVTSPGKLIKNTRNTLLLSAIASERFNWFDYGPPGVPPSGPPAQYQVQYQDPSWFRTAAWDDQAHVFQPLAVPLVIDMSSYHYLGMWSDSLGGSVSFVDGDDHITYFAQTLVNGASDLFAASDTVHLYGYFNCLASGITTTDANNGQVYLPEATDVQQPYDFEISKSDLTLFEATGHTQVGLATGEAPTTGPYQWGMRSGPMVLLPGGFTSTNDIWSADVFYTYETGANPWNHYTTITDSTGAFVTFDAPIQFTYTHHTADDRNGDSTYDLRNYFLSYGGPGNLGGIPNAGIDLDGDGSPDRWYPLFSIADGVLCGPTGTEYVIRGLDGEQTLTDAVGGCGTLDITDVYDLALPTEADFVQPTLGDAPVVTDPPHVIEGEVQGGGN